MFEPLYRKLDLGNVELSADLRLPVDPFDVAGLYRLFARRKQR
jgi:hypothetical protein